MADPSFNNTPYEMPQIPNGAAPVEELEEPPPLQWEMGDILCSNYTGDHFIPYNITIKKYRTNSFIEPRDTQVVEMHNMETGQATEMALSHVNSIGFYNVSRGEAPIEKLKAIKLSLQQEIRNNMSIEVICTTASQKAKAGRNQTNSINGLDIKTYSKSNTNKIIY